MADLLTRPLGELARCLARKEASPVDLMREALSRIDAERDLNAFVALKEEGDLLREARAAEERIGRGEGRPLEGMPLGVKDLEDVAGMVTSHGSKAFRDNVAEHDSIQVARLRAAGAIVVGKTNAPEFGATAITKNPLFGVTRNPWNLERTPGGSSGGSSAAIAAGLVPLVTAGDGGGSIRIPASFTGCFGLKTSYGRVPHGPTRYWIMDDTAVYGPLTRRVEDAALFLDVVSGPHPLDPNSLPHPGVSYRKVLRDLPRPLRIAFSPQLGHAVVQSDVASVVASAVRAFEEVGSPVETIEGGPPELGYDWGIVGAFHLLGELEPYLPERGDEFGRGFLSGVKVGARMTPRLWAEARLRREELNRVVRRRVRQIRPARHSDRALRSAAGAWAVPGDLGREKAPPGRASPPSPSPSTCRGTPPRPSAPASRARTSRSGCRSSARAIATISCSRPPSPSSRPARGRTAGPTAAPLEPRLCLAGVCASAEDGQRQARARQGLRGSSEVAVQSRGYCAREASAFQRRVDQLHARPRLIHSPSTQRKAVPPRQIDEPAATVAPPTVQVRVDAVSPALHSVPRLRHWPASQTNWAPAVQRVVPTA